MGGNKKEREKGKDRQTELLPRTITRQEYYNNIKYAKRQLLKSNCKADNRV